METEVDVSNPKLELVPGMYANASIVLDQKHGVLAVPVQALNRHGEQATVFRVNPQNQIEEVSVALGLESPNKAEVLGGLKEGDLVVVSGRSQLRPGENVRPKVIELPVGEGKS